MSRAPLIDLVRQRWDRYRRRRWIRWRRPDRIPRLQEYRNDALADLWQWQDQLLREGAIFWCSIVKANEHLYRPGGQCLPALVACDADGHFDDCVEALDHLASELGRCTLQNPLADDPVSLAVRDDYQRANGLPLPESLTGGPRILLYSALIYRPHLPAGMLHGTHLPGLYIESCPRVMAAPSHAWPTSLSEAWTPSPERLDRLAEEERQRQAFRRAGPLLEVTEAALKQFRLALESAEEQAAFVRIQIRNGEHSVSLTNQRLRTDEAREIRGLTFLIDPRTAANHWGLRIDYHSAGAQSGFTFKS